MESSEDWYNRFEMASFLRALRYVALAAATLLPGLYLAVIRFHTQVLPTNMILSFAQAREGVPFSSIAELVLLELSFELIRSMHCRHTGQMRSAGTSISTVHRGCRTVSMEKRYRKVRENS